MAQDATTPARLHRTALPGCTGRRGARGSRLAGTAPLPARTPRRGERRAGVTVGTGAGGVYCVPMTRRLRGAGGGLGGTAGGVGAGTGVGVLPGTRLAPVPLVLTLRLVLFRRSGLLPALRTL